MAAPETGTGGETGIGLEGEAEAETETVETAGAALVVVSNLLSATILTVIMTDGTDTRMDRNRGREEAETTETQIVAIQPRMVGVYV